MQLSFEWENKIIEFTVEYRRRKTISIIVEGPKQVRVAVPLGTSRKVILEQVKSKAAWIDKKLSSYGSAERMPLKKQFVSGECFFYLGGSYPLEVTIIPGIKKPQVQLGQGKLGITAGRRDEQFLREALEEWYRQKARVEIKERVERIQYLIGKKPNRIVIKAQRKRWGSCSSKANLNFNWRIIMAPSAVLDYIVVHEMCHLIHLNHSRAFWDAVSAILPDYKTSREWLKLNGYKLTI
jgi:predicted metal-dependent hydrolase